MKRLFVIYGERSLIKLSYILIILKGFEFNFKLQYMLNVYRYQYIYYIILFNRLILIFLFFDFKNFHFYQVDQALKTTSLISFMGKQQN